MLKQTKIRNTIKTMDVKKSRLKINLNDNLEKIKKPSEHIIQNSIIRYLLLHNFLVIRYNSGSLKVDNRYIKYYTIMNNMKYSGHPDLVAFKNGKCLFIEVKKHNGKLTDNQKEFQELSKRYNMNILTATSWEQVQEFLKNNQIF